MHAPEPWPYADLEAWRDWRTHLDHAQDPNVATLRREADCEIARIVRCTNSRWPKRPQLVPRGWVRRGVRA
jgi:hypothetical protein